VPTQAWALVALFSRCSVALGVIGNAQVAPPVRRRKLKSVLE
jgi:hypothetical protein